MKDSILLTIKKMLGLGSDYGVFDTDVIVGINSAIFVLTQLGIGPEEGFTICGPGETWEEFIGDSKQFEAVKSYIYIKTRLIFDPPTNSFLLDAFNKQAQEFEWRLNENAASKKESDSEGGETDDGDGIPDSTWLDACR